MTAAIISAAFRVGRRLLGAVLLAWMALPALAQQEDSLRLRRDSVPLAVPRWEEPSRPGLRGEVPRVPRPAAADTLRVRMRRVTWSEAQPELYIPYQQNRSPLFRGDYRTDGVLAPMSGGYWVAAGSQESVPGLGRFNAATLGWQKQLNDRLHLALMADALKANTLRFTGQSFGLSGQLLYQATDRVYFRTFGAVGTYDNFGSRPAYRFGGTVGWDITERFGVEAGAQTYFNSLTGRWEVLPVLAPYYKFDRFKLQFDVGPLLHEILRGIIQKHRGGGLRGGPTIMPDVPGFRH